jgi:shikimate kinase
MAKPERSPISLATVHGYHSAMTNPAFASPMKKRPLKDIAATVVARLDRPLALVGLMGSGKSAIGRRIACSLKLDFVDSDQQVVDTAGISIAEIFEIAGEAKFREMERAALAKTIAGPPKIIATGGGAFCQEDTAELMLKSSHVIWLKATPETLLARIGNPQSRPLLHADDPLATLIKLRDERTRFYQRAHIHIDTDGMTAQRAVRAMLESLDTFLGRQ